MKSPFSSVAAVQISISVLVRSEFAGLSDCCTDCEGAFSTVLYQ